MTNTNISARWTSWAPYLLSILRIVGAFMFMQFGTAKLFAFPAAVMPGGGTAPLTSLPGFAGALEVVGGALLLLGLFTRPVAFLQFADFLPLAFNQIMSEMGSMFWRTAGDWQCPVIVMVACGGYRPGLGPFHSQTFEALASHVPGIDIFMPSTAADAAGLLNAAFESGRPTLFFYP